MTLRNYEKQLNKLKLIFCPIVKFLCSSHGSYGPSLPPSFCDIYMHAVYDSDASTSFSDSFLGQAKLKFYYARLFWWAHVSPERGDLILFSIKRHWMNCFSFSPLFLALISNLVLAEAETRERKTKHRNYDFIFMHIHRTAWRCSLFSCRDWRHIAFGIVMAFWYLCNSSGRTVNGNQSRDCSCCEAKKASKPPQEATTKKESPAGSFLLASFEFLLNIH